MTTCPSCGVSLSRKDVGKGCYSCGRPDVLKCCPLQDLEDVVTVPTGTAGHKALTVRQCSRCKTVVVEQQDDSGLF